MNKIKKAIIIHGPGRSGTTLLSNMLSLHKDLYWISGYLNKFPQFPILSILNNLQAIEPFERFTRGRKKFPRPSEAYGFWNYHFENFNNETGILNSSEAESAINSITKVSRYTPGNRFITKITGLSRSEFIDAVFEDPCIIWIDRKPQSVVMSYYNQKWRYRNKVDVFKLKPKTELIEEYVCLYDKINVDKEKLRKFKFLQVYYEDLVADKTTFFRNICEFVDLDYNRDFNKIVDGWQVETNTNESYKRLIDKNEENLLDSLLFEYSKKLGYS